MGRIEVRSLTLGYNGTSVVEGLDLDIPQGKITALVGPNGCGKSTLLRGLARLLEPKGGSVYLDGKSIHALPTKEVARRMGILPQGPEAPEGLTVEDLVQQGRYPHLGFLQRRSAEDQAAVVNAMRITQVEQFKDRPLDTLSGGQRQRAWIAMALAQETEVLLLDEPTTFLDLAHQMEVLELLAELNRRGRTIVMVLHDLNQACRHSDHLVAIKDGGIYVQGAPREVLSTEMVADVFGVSCRLMADPLAGMPLCVPMGRSERINSSIAIE